MTFYAVGGAAEAALANGVSGLITVADSSHIIVSYQGGVIDTFLGSFSYGANSTVFGTLSAIQETYFGAPAYSLTDLNIAAGPVASALISGDNPTILSLIFGANDSIMGSTNGEIIEGGAGNDVIIALDGNDTVDGGDGNDDVNGNKGDDIVLGGAGDDTVRGGQGNDTISGGDGNDPHVNGNIGDDIVHGGNGNDTVYGGQGSDTLYGDAGDDLLSGDLGNDLLFGGAGADRFTIAHGGGFDWVGDFNAAEGDRIQLAPGTAYAVTSVSGQVVIDLGAGDELGLVGVAAGSFSNAWIVFG